MTAAADSRPDQTDTPEVVPAEPATAPDAVEETAATRPEASVTAGEAPTLEEAPVKDPAEEASAPDVPADDATAEETAVTDDALSSVSVTEDAPAPAPAPAPTPSPRPGPVPTPGPRGPLPRAPRPAAPATPAIPSPAADEPWGRVDDEGTVEVREGGAWREVGQYPDGTPAEALAYFERKYADLASEVVLLETRHRAGGASAADLRTTAKALHERIVGAAAVGDLVRLASRVEVLTGDLAAESETEAAAAREAVQEAVAQRTALVEQAEALAARDPKTIQWKQASAELTSLFDQWQAQQQNGPRLSKSVSQQLWKRFRDARAIVDKHRREFYAGLDEEHKSVRDRKTRLVEKAEALAPKGEDGIGAYRDLLDEWKTAGRAGKKVDDALWARFKAAGDALYSARGEREAADAEESREKIEAKRELLVEARTVADVSDLAKARAQLTAIQRRWDEVGRIFPRDKERALDDDLRKIEQALRGREDVDWKRNDPAQKARANDMTRQLTDAIDKLEEEVAAAKKAGDKKAEARAVEALDARKAWLKALGG
ncbi:DUF349 domain-containing protein [Microbacterium sp. CJ88]|uniref:DUF349 domain-containing protein n=1 Tax=Microbacterium sp. CJ88 TaxID=3445672 RepID=UPI003F655269